MATAIPRIAVRPRISLKVGAFYELAKPNLSALVVLTSAFGFYFASRGVGSIDWAACLHLILGTGLTAAGACGINMVAERGSDAQMHRTRRRPIPSGRLTPKEALFFSLAVFLLGFLDLLVFCGPYPAALSFLTMVIYAGVYTPLKTQGPLAIWVGAIPGAIPPVMGWTAVQGEIGLGGWVLFAILFAWQFPHFLSLAFMYREDYARGGFRFLPENDPDGKRTGRQIAVGWVVLLLVSTTPTWVGLAGNIYLVGAVLCGLTFTWIGLRTARACSLQNARSSFLASVTHLPLLLALMILDGLLG